jgi:hypothetical protein
MTNEVAFYRQLTATLIERTKDLRERYALSPHGIDDEGGRLQFTITGKDLRKEIVRLNFSGSVPCLFIGEVPYPLQVVGPDLVNLRGDEKCQFSVDGLTAFIAQRMSKELADTEGAKT